MNGEPRGAPIITHEMDWRPTQLLALEGQSRKVTSDRVCDIFYFLVRSDGMWAKFGYLASPEADKARRAALLFGIKDTSLNSFVQPLTRPGMIYNELERYRIRHLPGDSHGTE